jgi:tetratricopeptide (TPR) repeat protein/tRNA A-37 threonylcarbamoyl transferase component Bud32
VYEAYDPQLDRKIAIKLLHERGAAEAEVRLLREGQALAKLAHPNVVAVHDVGLVEGDGSIFVAMELVDGLTLSAWLGERERDWTEIRDVMLQAGRGLLAAHEAGLVHRDFKPANVLVGRDGRVRVLDFGLARAVATADVAAAGAPTSTLGQTVTAAGTLMGTPAYMAPEQIASGDVGPRSDQFGFCVALYEALYGSRPFRGDDVVQTLVAMQRCVLPPMPASTRVPPWLHAVVARGLSRDPTARFPDMGALLHAMVLDLRSRRRQRIGVAIALAATAAIAVAATLALRPEPSPAEVELVDRLTADARAAAAKSYFVYPPVDEPDADTAYRKVRELETQGGPIDELADRRAEELRTEFAATLVRLGDEYWEREGGAAFASDYYAAALVFDPEHGHARARTTLSPGEVHALADKADSGAFSSSELLAGASLAVLAEADPQARREKAGILLARSDGPAPSTSARLRDLVDDAPSAAPARVAATTSSPTPTPADSVVDASASPPIAQAPGVAKAEAPAKREDADALVAAAARATKAGRTAEAQELLHRALRADRGHAEALAALGHIHFEAAQYHKAIHYAARAVEAAPKRASYRILLGDAHFRVLAYDAARVQYEQAATLGHPSAAKRVKLLDERIGGASPK